MTDNLPVPAEPPAPRRRAKHTLPDFIPVPRLKDRSNGWRPEVQRAFIEALADTGSVRAACRAVGRSECGAYQMRRHPEGASFRKAWEAALDIGIQRIEDIAMDRALNGVEVPVYSYGKLVGTRRIYNDRLLMFLLRNRAPKRFAASGNGAGGGGSAGRGGSGGTGGILKVVEERKMRRLKKLWFEEWQAEQIAKSPSAAEIRASINRKIEAVKHRIEANTSPRALKLDLVARAQRSADHEAGWRPGKPYEEYAALAAELFPQILARLSADPANQKWVAWDDGDDDDIDDHDNDNEVPETLLLEDGR